MSIDSDKILNPTTIKSFALKDKGLKCYSEQRGNKIICNAEEFKDLWYDDVQKKYCIHQEEKGGKMFCRCGDVLNEYHVEFVEREEKKKQDDAFKEKYLEITGL